VQHEAHAWWKPPLADEFHQLRVGAEFPTEPLSGTTELNVVIELLDIDGPRAEQTDGELEAWVIDDAPVSDEPVLIPSVNWTLETDEQELDLTIAIDTTGFTDGWHRLQLAGIITGDESDDTDSSAAPPPPAPLIPGAWFVANGNGSPIAPFGTMQEGLDAADAGHVIIVGPGTYHENLTTRRNGTPSKQILLAAQDGLGSVQIVDATNDTVLNVAHAYLVVSGFIFDGNLSPQHTVVIRDGGDYLSFGDNEVGRSGKDCIHMAGPEGVRVERTVLHDCQPS